MTNSLQVRTRIAPSPTGDFHIGHLSTALRNLAFARKHGGKFIIRVEDTDRERFVKDSVKKTLTLLKVLGLSWDEGPNIGGPHKPYVQSKRLKIYQSHTAQLVDQNKAYYCFCTKQRLEKMRKDQQKNKQLPRYDRTCLKLSPAQIKTKLNSKTPRVVRLKVPTDSKITFTDLIRGQIAFDSREVDDQVLLKSDGFPTYHLAVVVDDKLMKISHIIRGEEWISSTPKHILLYQAFGWEPPVYAHTPVFLNPSGKGKMSKRHGAVSAQSFLDQGYLPDALLNFLMIMGWAPKDKQEILSLENFFNQFTLENISPKSVIFDTAKLDWLNGIYIRKLTTQDLITALQPHLSRDFPKDKLEAILPLIKDRLVKLSDVKELTDFFHQTPRPSAQALLKNETASLVVTQLKSTLDSLRNIKSWNLALIEDAIRKLQEANHWPKSQYFMLLRVAATGKTATPPLFETIELIGKKQLINRITAAIKEITS